MLKTHRLIRTEQKRFLRLTLWASQFLKNLLWDLCLFSLSFLDRIYENCDYLKMRFFFKIINSLSNNSEVDIGEWAVVQTRCLIFVQTENLNLNINKNKVIRPKSRASALSKKVFQTDRQTDSFFFKKTFEMAVYSFKFLLHYSET